MLLGLEHLEECLVPVPVGQAGQDRQGVHPVVGFTRILRVPVAGSRPGDAVDGLAQGQHLRPVPGAFALKSDRIGHVGDGL